MTLYLKYRPRDFADVVGQDHIVTTLEQAIEKDRISHAYLFCGTRGTGKTSVARILAKTILLRGIEDEALKIQMIKGIDEGSLVDFIEIDGASNRKIDDVRDLIEKINFSPAVSKAKVYIIDEVHMLTKEAFNALLKTIEEPPDYAYFILATTELHKVPETIQSRCQRFLFKRVKDDDIVRRLQYIVDQEHITTDRDALRAIAHHATGSFRDGIALLDQLRSLSKIGLSDVTERIGKTSAIFLEDLFAAIGDKDIPKITGLIAQMEEANIPLDTVAADLLSHIRNGMYDAIQAKESPLPYIKMMDILLQALKDLRLSPVPGLVLESALIMLCIDDLDHAKPTPRIKSPEKPKIVEKPSLPTPQETQHIVTAKSEPSTQKKGIVEAEDLNLETIQKHWGRLLQEVSPSSVRMSLKDATVTSAEDSTVQLTFASSFHRDKVADIKASRTIEEILQSIYLRPIRIRCAVESSTMRIEHEPETDLVEAAAEVFGGL